MRAAGLNPDPGSPGYLQGNAGIVRSYTTDGDFLRGCAGIPVSGQNKGHNS